MNPKEMLELNCYLAAHVMGLDVSQMVLCEDSIYSWFEPAVEGNRYLVKFSPTTDPAAAMQVLEKCIKKVDGNIEITIVSSGMYRISSDLKNLEWAETLPLSICLFAKKLFTPHD